MTDEEQAGDLVAAPVKPTACWQWIYQVVGDDGAKRNVENAVHLFPGAKIVSADPVLAYDGRTPICKRELAGVPNDWRIFNLGAADPVRMAKISGNHVEICAACDAVKGDYDVR